MILTTNDHPGLPRTVEQAVERLCEMLADDQAREMARLPDAQTFAGWHHFGLGNFARNHFGLHGVNRPLLEDALGERGPEMAAAGWGADEASGAILRALYARLRAAHPDEPSYVRCPACRAYHAPPAHEA